MYALTADVSALIKGWVDNREILFKASAFDASGAKQRQLVQEAADAMTGVATAGRHLPVARATASCYTIAGFHYRHTIDIQRLDIT